MNANERLNVVLQSLGLKQKDFAESIGTTQATLSRQLKGVHKIDKQVALAIEAVHGVSSIWLLIGEGEMFTSSLKENKVKEVKHLKGIAGNAETFPNITDVEQIAHTKWFENLLKEQKEIVAGLCMIKSKEALKRFASLIIAQVQKEEAEDDLRQGLKELEEELISDLNKRKKIQKGEAG